MRSLLIEFHRFGELTTGLLRQDDLYLVAAASHPICQVKMQVSYAEFAKLLKPLRYGVAGAAERAEALQKIGGYVTTLLRSKELDDLETGEFPLQLDLVVNAAELAALPFEMAFDQAGTPLLIRSNKPVILTRRVRNNFAESGEPWPAKARVLFAWARPCPEVLTTPIPCAEHEAALRRALSSWIPLGDISGKPPDVSNVLQVLPDATLATLRAACQESVDQKKPFTHVHLLGHGYPVGESPEQVFGIALDGDLDCKNLKAANPEEISAALSPLRGHAVVLSLAVCDSANDANMIMPERSIAHELHVCGFPVVIGSQLPLTVPGSTILVENFYGELLAGNDVRVALHKARGALFENSAEAGHDWASITGYVRLPEGYCDHLPAVRLEAVLTSLKAIQSWSDDLIKSDAKDATRFEHLIALLGENITRLKSFLDQPDALPKGVPEENMGLLGSAEKRRAELYFEFGLRSGTDHWAKDMRESLERARSWYQKGFETNLSHHWTGVQYLSLDTVLTGKITEPDFWHAAVLAAELDAKKPGEVWACGSLAELYLLASAAGIPDQDEKDLKAIQEMKSRLASSDPGNPFPLESTRRQLQRYVNWWTSGHGFFPGHPDLSARATRLSKALQTP